MYGFAGSLLIAGAAYWKRSLASSGFAAAVVLGTIMYALGSLAWFGTLIVFFVTSSLLSKVKHSRKDAAEGGYAKGSQRDAGQVLANGGLAGVLCVINAIVPHPAWWALFIGVMATVNADTWATELGSLSRRPPRSIVTGRIVTPGTSGGVSRLGLAATACGAVVIGLAAWALLQAEPSQLGGPVASGSAAGLWLVAVAALGGVAGSLADSYLGATLQGMYRCSVCGSEVERRLHCGQPTVRVRGLRWMSNDAVNALSSLIGGGVALLVASLLS